MLLIFGSIANAQTNLTPYGKTSWSESVQPIRAGAPGKVPFWNSYAKRFIYAPAFDFKQIDGAKSYRFDVVSEKNSKTYSFKKEAPYAPLSPVWASVPMGYVNLKVSALDGNGKVIGLAGEKRFYRAAPFNGVYHKPVMPYDQSAKVALEHLLNEDYVQYWLANKKPDPNYLNYRYPAKIYSALVIGAIDYARLNKGTPKAEEAMKLAKIVADFMLSIRYEPGSKWEYFVPTYYGTKFPEDKPHMRAHVNFTIMGVDAGHAFLDLYDYTKNDTYLQAAKAIAGTYLKNQEQNGSWHQFVDYKTNSPVAENIAIPTSIINYFDRLKTSYKVTTLENATKKALDYIENEPMKTYNWQGQFEDVAARPPYVNLSREQASDYAIYLLNNYAGNKKRLADAEDLIRFAEDQFVIWEQPMDKPKKSNNPGRVPQNWIMPSVQEQSVFWEPVGRSAGIMISTYLHAYDKTGKSIYLAKAQSIGNSFTLVQQAHKGEYPTFFTKYKLPLWLNSVVYPAKIMIALQDVTEKSKK
jgi:maltose/maltodextrin transport system substrate-binding protein